MISCIIRFSLVVLSSIFLILSFPDFNLGFLSWVGLIPLIISINGKRAIPSFLLSLACGILFFSGTFYWMHAVQAFSLLYHIPLLIYFGLYFGVFGVLYSFVHNRLGVTPALFSAPFIWVSLEYVRANLSFLSLPWALLAHSQYHYPPVIQIASLTGTYSISFLIVMVNAALATIICTKIPSTLPLIKGGEEKFKGREALLILTGTLIIITLSYGFLITSQPILGNKTKISLVQGNIEQAKKWDPLFARDIKRMYAELTRQVAEEQPALIVWPETATPESITQSPFYYKELTELAQNTGVYLLLGSAHHQKFQERGQKKKLKYYNSAFLIPPGLQGERTQLYEKIKLFPFSEYLPYREKIPWSIIGIDVSLSDNYTPGDKFPVFQHPDFRFGATICWENIFPALVREFVKQGAQVMINITNEAHFGKTAAPHQLVSISVFRAVENRVYVVRCANTGVSCILDPYGRIVDRIKDASGQDVIVRGVMTGWIVPLDSKTIYTRYGDWFVWVAMVGSVVFLAIATAKRKRSTNN